MSKAKSAAKSQAPVATSFDLLAARIQKIINSPAAQKNRVAVIYKAPEESQEDWGTLVEAMEGTDGVRLAFQDDGGVHVSWEKPLED